MGNEGLDDRGSYRRFLSAAVEAAVHAGDMLRKAENQRRTIDYKGKINLVTEMDRRVERYIGAELRRQFPDHDLLAEEDEGNVQSGSEYRWIVDPLDGTTNYAHGLPIYSVSIALEYRGAIVIGAVYQPPLREMFTAMRGSGAQLNGLPIRVASETELAHSLLVTGFPYDMHESEKDNLDHFRNFMKTARAVRRLGSAALDLCYVACGRFDGFWEIKLSPWDLAAGSLIAGEAGVTLTSLSGGEFSIYDGTIVAANATLHAQMLDVLRRPGAPPASPL